MLSILGGALFDAEYIQALTNRRQDIEQHFVAHFFRPVQAKLRTQLRSPELAQDACQETFLRVLAYFRSGKTLDNPASLPGFVHSVCHNIGLEFLRSHTRHPQVAENAPDPIDPMPDPESQALGEQRKEIVRRILRDLPEKDRELLRRVFLNEEDKDRVCRDLGVERDYLRVLLYRARVRMKSALLRSDFGRTTHQAGQ